MGNISMNKQLGTRWFTFYTKVRPWLICLTCFTVIVDFALYTEVYLNNFFLLVYFAAAIAQTVLAVITVIKSEEDYGAFVRFVKGVLLFEMIYIAYQQGIQQYIKSFDYDYALLIFIVVLVISYFVWYKLNIKYFEKRIIRKNQENAELSSEINHDITKVEELVETSANIKVSYCRKCGAKLGEDALFCRKCGTKIENSR